MATIAITDRQITRSDLESCVVVQVVDVSPRALESDNKRPSTLASKDSWNGVRIIPVVSWTGNWLGGEVSRLCFSV